MGLRHMLDMEKLDRTGAVTFDLVETMANIRREISAVMRKHSSKATITFTVRVSTMMDYPNAQPDDDKLIGYLGSFPTDDCGGAVYPTMLSSVLFVEVVVDTDTVLVVRDMERVAREIDAFYNSKLPEGIECVGFGYALKVVEA